MAKSCRSCVNHLDHCRGLLIVHDGWTECTDDATCPGPDPVLHDARMECDCCVTLEVSVALVA